MMNLDCSAFGASCDIWGGKALRKHYRKHRKFIDDGDVAFSQSRKEARKIDRPNSGLLYFLLRKFLQSISYTSFPEFNYISEFRNFHAALTESSVYLSRFY